jgi:hypothetical protein
MIKDNGGPAFPSNAHTLDVERGMTLRDYFAAKAMQSLVSEGYQFMNVLSMDAYAMADAMLLERAK